MIFKLLCLKNLKFSAILSLLFLDIILHEYKLDINTAEFILSAAHQKEDLIDR